MEAQCNRLVDDVINIDTHDDINLIRLNFNIKRYDDYDITWGAENKMANVDTIVNIVNIQRQSLSTTLAAHFQSLSDSADSSSFLTLSVKNLISLSISRNSCLGWQPCELSSILIPVKFCMLLPRKSSSRSSTFASRLRDDRSRISTSRILRDDELRLATFFLDIFCPGLFIRSTHANHSQIPFLT